MAGQQRSEGFVHQRRVWLPGRPAGALEEACVHGRAQACATHATIMPQVVTEGASWSPVHRRQAAGVALTTPQVPAGGVGCCPDARGVRVPRHDRAQFRRCAMSALLVGYARCSTDQQDLTAQRDALLRLGVEAERIYVDHGLTGTNRERPGLREALAACR